MNDAQTTPAPGYCQCGCGQRTAVAKRNRRELGHVKGEPIAYVNGHNAYGRRDRQWTEEDCGHETKCWVWGGYVAANGYGKATVDGGMGYAHRVVYEEHVGPIPVGLDLDHLCRTRACVNPDHLEPVTRSENLRRGFISRKDRAHAPPGT